jgi:hypothetical protein
VNIRLTQIDGALPNLALMKLAHWHRAQGDYVHVTRHLENEPLWELDYERVYGSAIFSFSEKRIERFKAAWPDAVLGGTGIVGSQVTVENLIGVDEYEHYDYDGWPDFAESIGFTQRGCRLKCKFCVVPQKEGKNRSVNAIANIWRGEGHPKKLHILDNDFFGQPREEWQARIAEIRDGKFKVCISQGVNVRLIDDDACEALATIQYRNTKFNERRLYTAWDNLHDERVFFKGVDRLEKAGIPPKHLMVYMLVGYDPLETWDRIWYRFNAMVARGVLPYPMVYEKTAKPKLRAFQRWVITGMYRSKDIPFEKYEVSMKRPRGSLC